MPCPKCPCPATCLRRPDFCRWAAEDPPSPVRLRHICGRSAMPAGAATAPAATTPAAMATAVPAAPARPPNPDVARTMGLIRRARECPHASRDSACGCAGIKCAKRPPEASVGSLQDCLACLEAGADA